MLRAPLAGEAMLRYRDFVDANRALVHDRTGGRVGYVHIPNMMAWGYAEFHRSFLTEYDREALLVDVRWNGGGLENVLQTGASVGGGDLVELSIADVTANGDLLIIGSINREADRALLLLPR